MNDPLAQAFRYNQWANLTLLESCRELMPALLDARPANVSGSIGELIVHLVGGQQSFVLRTKGQQHEDELTRYSLWPGIEVLLALAMSTSSELLEVAKRLDEDRYVSLLYQGTYFSYPLSFILTHALEHGVEHRTEIKIALASLGVQTPDLDGWAYANARGYGPEVQAPSSESR